MELENLNILHGNSKSQSKNHEDAGALVKRSDYYQPEPVRVHVSYKAARDMVT